jgi:integrase
VQRAWAARRPDCDFLWHVNGRPLGNMKYEFKRACLALGIPYGRGRGVVFHDARHSAVSNLVGAGVPEAAAMTITGHADSNVFRRHNVRRDAVQAAALTQVTEYLSQQRGRRKTATRSR